MEEPPVTPSETPIPIGFAPYDFTDGRAPGDWASRYTDTKAREGIRLEAIYVGILLAIVPVLIFVVWMEWPKSWLGLSDPRYASFERYALAWLSGTLGGTLFGIKWLYHAIAKREWHLDRRLWRLFTPHISGGLSFGVIALISSGLVHIFDAGAMQATPAVVGLSFLTGYFSDSAVAKLSQLAETLFGESRSKAQTKAIRSDAVQSPGESKEGFGD